MTEKNSISVQAARRRIGSGAMIATRSGELRVPMARLLR
jgi:hypothetical protein